VHYLDNKVFDIIDAQCNHEHYKCVGWKYCPNVYTTNFTLMSVVEQHTSPIC